MTPEESLRLLNRCFRVIARSIPPADVIHRLDIATRFVQVFEEEEHELPVVHMLPDVSELEDEVVDGYLSVHPDPKYAYVASLDCYRCRHHRSDHAPGDPRRHDLKCTRPGCECGGFYFLSDVSNPNRVEWLRKTYDGRHAPVGGAAE